MPPLEISSQHVSGTYLFQNQCLCRVKEVVLEVGLLKGSGDL